jgi:thiol:disulfide interchange protein
MDHIKFRKRNIQLIGLDVDKKNPNEDEIKYNIINVPTFIFYREGKEINRIVELTIESIEKDILKILDGTGYQNAYYGF